MGQRVQLEGLLAYAHAHPQNSTRENNKHYSLTKSHIYIILNEVGSNPYRPTSVQALMTGDFRGAMISATSSWTAYKYSHRFLPKSYGWIRQVFLVIPCTKSRISIPGLGKNPDALLKFDIQYAGR